MRFISFVRSVMTVVMALAFVLVSCQREPDAKVSNITLYVESLEAQPEGDTFRINYSIVKPAEGVSLEVACDAEWVSVDVVAASFVDITVAKNDSGEERAATLNFSYGNDTNSLTISQKAWEAPVALKVEDVEATAVVFSVTT
ncbi:MAG: BACON domain-containing protein, partial [Alistipes sp.]|nr:BACON domain-containing protein [Alistipes sp.]